MITSKLFAAGIIVLLIAVILMSCVAIGFGIKSYFRKHAQLAQTIVIVIASFTAIILCGYLMNEFLTFFHGTV